MQPSFIIVSSTCSSNSSCLSSDLQMALGDSRISTGLGLGLASLKEEETPLNFKINSNNKKHGSRNHQMMMMKKKKKPSPSSSSSLLMSFEPCLTLGLFSSSSEEYAVNNNSSNTEENNSDDVNYNRQGSDSDPPLSISTVSSPSNNNNNNLSITNIKRERAADRHGSSDQEMEASRVNDEDEDCNNTIRKKLRLTKEQSSLLEESFKQHSTLHPNQKQALASQLNLQPRQVEVWFQNRRARTKLKQTEVDCEFLKKCCETLTDENTRLQKEIQELKAIKASQQQQPFFMQLPAATLTICPSCERRGRNGSVVTTADGSPKKSFSMAASNNIKHLYCNPFTNPSTAC